MTRRTAVHIVLAVSLTLNALLTGAIALYIHFAGLFDVVSTAVSFFN